MNDIIFSINYNKKLHKGHFLLVKIDFFIVIIKVALLFDIFVFSQIKYYCIAIVLWDFLEIRYYSAIMLLPSKAPRGLFRGGFIRR